MEAVLIFGIMFGTILGVLYMEHRERMARIKAGEGTGLSETPTWTYEKRYPEYRYEKREYEKGKENLRGDSVE